jgi:hypothetical protein
VRNIFAGSHPEHHRRCSNISTSLSYDRDKKLHTFRQLPKDLNDQNKRNLEDDIQCACEGYYV